MEKLMKLHRNHTNFPTEDLHQKQKGEPKKYYAWFSETAKMNAEKWTGSERKPLSNIYLNENNEKIEVTHVTRSANPNVYFDDIEYRGIVIKWVHSIYE